MSQPSWIGHTIGGRYKVEALLGQGGMSAVYKGADPNLRRTVAIKLIHPHLSSDPEFVRRFEQEAAAVAQLRHPNIIQVFDFNHDGGVYFMVLEYLPGETLQARLKALDASHQRLSLGETLRIMAGICEAVAYAHQRGMIHRDLKPGNVMLDQQNQPILMDFGVAKILGGQHHTATGAIVGTVAYMSPEQARGEHIDERSDIYSLGIMLYEMTTGRPPFEGDSAMTVMLKHLNEAVPDIRQVVEEVPEGLAALIEKSLTKNPADRVQTAGEMAAILRAIAADLQAMPTGAVAPEPAIRTLVAPPAQPPTAVRTPAAATAPTAKTEAAAVPQAPVPEAPAVTPPGASEIATTIRQAAEQPGETRVAMPAKKGGLPVGVFVGVGALVIVAIIVGVSVLSRAGSQRQPTPTAAATSAAIVEVSPTSLPPSAAPSEAALATQRPPTAVPSPTAPPPTAVPTLAPTATEAALPEGMVLVPGSPFDMGSTDRLDERPVHRVTLSSFLIDRYEVTNARYRQCVDAKACTPPTIKGSFTRASYFDHPEFDNYPVIKVTWEQATAFCAWEDKRLPTEAEWEYAARGTDRRRFPWGNEFDRQRVPVADSDTVEVGSLDNASPFGVYDMAGNVVEWTADWYRAAYYAESPTENPAGPETGLQRVMRGGSFGNADGQFYTTTRRYNQRPGFHDVDIGFRCVRSVP